MGTRHLHNRMTAQTASVKDVVLAPPSGHQPAARID